jgi:hypothetical protein
MGSAAKAVAAKRVAMKARAAISGLVFNVLVI